MQFRNVREIFVPPIPHLDAYTAVAPASSVVNHTDFSLLVQCIGLSTIDEAAMWSPWS